MLECGGCHQPLGGIASEQATEQLESFRGQLHLGEQITKEVVPLRVQLRHHLGGEWCQREARPHAVVRDAEHIEDGAKMSIVMGSLEQRPAIVNE